MIHINYGAFDMSYIMVHSSYKAIFGHLKIHENYLLIRSTYTIQWNKQIK